MEQYLRGVVPAEMPSTWPTEALQGPGDRRPLVRGAPAAPGRLLLRRHRRRPASQVYRGVEGEKAPTNAAITATAGVVLKSGSSIANTLFHSTGGGATEHNENVYMSVDRGEGRGVAGQLPARLDGPTADATAYDAGAPYATWATETYTASPAVGDLRDRRADERRDADRRSTCAIGACPGG